MCHAEAHPKGASRKEVPQADVPCCVHIRLGRKFLAHIYEGTSDAAAQRLGVLLARKLYTVKVDFPPRRTPTFKSGLAREHHDQTKTTSYPSHQGSGARSPSFLLYGDFVALDLLVGVR